MRILVISPYVPYPPNSGGRMRIWQELRFLAAHHELTLIAFYQLEPTDEEQEAMRQICRRVFLVKRPAHPLASDLDAFRAVSDLFKWYTTPEMARTLQTLQSETFDLLILHHIFVAEYHTWFNVPAVLEEHNIESVLFQQHACAPGVTGEERTFRQARWLLLRNYETTMWQQIPLRVVVSEHDKQEMQRRCPDGRTIVVENGINTRETEMLPPTTSRVLLFMGSLDFYANIDAVLYLRQEILPRLWRQDPQISLVIAGRRPPAAVRTLADDPRIRLVPDPDDESMTGLVRDCALTLAPMRIGSGTRIKLLHSMAFGRPAVTTPLGCEGLAVTDGSELLVRDTPQAFADAVMELLDDPELAGRLRQAGRRLVETHYDWHLLLGKYEQELYALRSGQ